MTKTDLVRACEDMRLRWIEDPTNASRSANIRNRVRHALEDARSHVYKTASKPQTRVNNTVLPSTSAAAVEAAVAAAAVSAAAGHLARAGERLFDALRLAWLESIVIDLRKEDMDEEKEEEEEKGKTNALSSTTKMPYSIAAATTTATDTAAGSFNNGYNDHRIVTGTIYLYSDRLLQPHHGPSVQAALIAAVLQAVSGASLPPSASAVNRVLAAIRRHHHAATTIEADTNAKTKSQTMSVYGCLFTMLNTRHCQKENHHADGDGGNADSGIGSSVFEFRRQPPAASHPSSQPVPLPPHGLLWDGRFSVTPTLNNSTRTSETTTTPTTTPAGAGACTETASAVYVRSMTRKEAGFLLDTAGSAVPQGKRGAAVDALIIMPAVVDSRGTIVAVPGFYSLLALLGGSNDNNNVIIDTRHRSTADIDDSVSTQMATTTTTTTTTTATICPLHQQHDYAAHWYPQGPAAAAAVYS